MVEKIAIIEWIDEGFFKRQVGQQRSAW